MCGGLTAAQAGLEIGHADNSNAEAGSTIVSKVPSIHVLESNWTCQDQPELIPKLRFPSYPVILNDWQVYGLFTTAARVLSQVLRPCAVVPSHQLLLTGRCNDLLCLLFCNAQDTVLHTLGDGLPGVVNALVAALDHGSPLCVAAAAGALTRIGAYKDVGPRLIEHSSAIPALVGVIKRRIPSRDLEKEAVIFRRYAPEQRSVCAS